MEGHHHSPVGGAGSVKKSKEVGVGGPGETPQLSCNILHSHDSERFSRPFPTWDPRAGIVTVILQMRNLKRREAKVTPVGTANPWPRRRAASLIFLPGCGTAKEI